MGRALLERHFNQISRTQSSHLKPLLYIGIPPRERENIISPSHPACTFKSNDFSELPPKSLGICFEVFFLFVLEGEVQQKFLNRLWLHHYQAHLQLLALEQQAAFGKPG